jgi:hypothetical protein
MLGTFAKEHTAVGFQMADQVLALHSALFTAALQSQLCDLPPSTREFIASLSLNQGTRAIRVRATHCALFIP